MHRAAYDGYARDLASKECKHNIDAVDARGEQSGRKAFSVRKRRRSCDKATEPICDLPEVSRCE